MTKPTKATELYLLHPREDARHAHDPWQVDGTGIRAVVRATSPRDARTRAAVRAASMGDVEAGE